MCWQACWRSPRYCCCCCCWWWWWWWCTQWWWCGSRTQISESRRPRWCSTASQFWTGRWSVAAEWPLSQTVQLSSGSVRWWHGGGRRWCRQESPQKLVTTVNLQVAVSQCKKSSYKYPPENLAPEITQEKASSADIFINIAVLDLTLTRPLFYLIHWPLQKNIQLDSHNLPLQNNLLCFLPRTSYPKYPPIYQFQLYM